MSTQPQKVTVSFNSIKETPIKPTRVGKRPASQTDMKARGIVQLFKAEKQVQRIFPILAQNGTISFHEINLFYLMNSFTNNTSLAQRPVFVSTNLDPEQYTTRDNRVMFNDSNPDMIRNIFANNSSYNSAFLQYNIDTVMIPFTTNSKDNVALNWDNDKHNFHVKKLAYKLEQINASQSTASMKDTAYREAWAEYEAVEKALVESGLLVPNNVLVALQSSVVPTISVHQTMNNPNMYFSGKALFSNEKTRATYAPIINQMNAVVQFTDSTMDSKSNWTYGLRSNSNQSNTGNNTDETVNQGASYSVEAKVYNLSNKELDEPVRVIISSLNYQNTQERPTRFQEFVKNNPMGSITNATLVLGLAMGGFTSRFSLEGNDISYHSFKTMATDNTASIGNVDLSDDLTIESTDDFMSFDPTQLESEVSLGLPSATTSITNTAKQF